MDPKHFVVSVAVYDKTQQPMIEGRIILGI